MFSFETSFVCISFAINNNNTTLGNAFTCVNAKNAVHIFFGLEITLFNIKTQKSFIITLAYFLITLV